jgi:ComF family protein
MKISALADAVLDLFYPRYCLVCFISLNNTANKALCSGCRNKIEFINQATSCLKCGIGLGPYVQPETLCRECFYHPQRFNRVFAVGRYENVLKELIHQFKYAKEKVLLDDLSSLLIDKYFKISSLSETIEMIIPTPIYYKKLKERGFNQSELLAERLSDVSGIPLEINNLVKVRETPDQASLDKRARQHNLADAFSIKIPERIKGKNILLIDDVLTTGATASEISRVLKKNGAKNIYVLTLAR